MLRFPDRDRFDDLKETVGMDEFDAKLAQYVRRAEAGGDPCHPLGSTRRGTGSRR